jgi:hypothetical protein
LDFFAFGSSPKAAVALARLLPLAFLGAKHQQGQNIEMSHNGFTVKDDEIHKEALLARKKQ